MVELTRDLRSEAGKCIFRVLTRHGSQGLRFWGTCFEVAPCLALTARHVVTGIMQRFHDRVISTDKEIRAYLRTAKAERDMSQYGIFVLQEENAHRFVSRKVAGFAWTPLSDIAWLLLQPVEPELEQGKMALTVEPPRLSSSLRVYGYPERIDDYLPDGDPVVLGEPLMLEASVLEVRPKARLFPAPCVQFTAACLPGGLSGGPVIDEYGRVCAVFCAGFPSPGLPDLGTAALMLHAFTTAPLYLPKEAGGNEVSPYTFAKDGRLAVHGLEKLHVEGNRLTYKGSLDYPPETEDLG